MTLIKRSRDIICFCDFHFYRNEKRLKKEVDALKGKTGYQKQLVSCWSVMMFWWVRGDGLTYTRSKLS